MKYNVIYARRRGLSITVSRNNIITVRCPKGTAKEYIEEVLNSKRGWIEKITSKNNEELNRNADIYDYKSIFVAGKKVPLYINCEKNEINPNSVCVKSLTAIKILFIEKFSGEFLQLVKNVSAVTGLQYKDCKIKSYKSRWGCCTGENEIIFNFRLFMLPPEIVNYVIVHELCHTRQHNHSSGFWQLVARFVPDYKTLRKKLKNYNFLTTLY